MAATKASGRPGRPKSATATPDHVPDLMVRGLTTQDMTALEEETAARTAALPTGAKMSRNAVAIALLREALAASKARREGGAP